MATARKKSMKVSSPKVSKSDASNDEALQEYVKNVTDWYSYYNEHIERARNFLTFLYVDQWDLTIRQAREAINKPTMQFNKVTAIIRSILGEQRNNCPNLAVNGVGKDIKQETVDIYDGLVRQIQYESDSDIVYQIAGKHGLECGWGSARVVAEYEGPNTFKQCLRIKPIVDFQSAFWDPSAQEPDKMDGDYCGVYTTMSMEKFKKLYPKIENPESISGLTNNPYFRWNTRDTITICEIYRKEYFTKNLVQLSDGNEIDEDKANKVLEMQEQYLAANPDSELLGFTKLEIANTRKVKDYKIKNIQFIQNKTLEETDYPGKLLPIPYFEGDSVVIDGEQIPIPYVQDAIDIQKLINYIGSEIAYGILKSRKETVMGTADQFKGHEDEWLYPDRVQGWLEYNWDDKAGKPDFISPAPFNPAFLSAYASAGQDLMQILGRFEESRGEETNAISGKAINARQRAANKPVNLYEDNNQRGIKCIGKILLDMIPHIYDTERTVMTRGADNQSKAVDINKQKGFRMLPNGDVEPHIENDLTVGKYDIEIRVDGSYDAQQAEAMDVLIRLATINPQISNLIPDLLAEVTGLENTPQLVERLKTLVPPQILAKEEGKQLPPPPPQPPDPMIEIQKERNKIESDKNAIAMEQNQIKARQQLLDEQKLMQEGQIAGLQVKGTLAKAAAEVHKATTEKDIAILNHGNTMRQHSARPSV